MLRLVAFVALFNCLYSGPVPASIDWRTKGAVLPVPPKDESMMSSLVNALDALSAAHAINYKKLIQLSTQQIYDCGGDLCPGKVFVGAAHVYDLIIKEGLNYSMDSAESYPYTGKCDKKCNFNKKGAVTQFAGYLNASNEAELELLLQEGPVIVTVEAIPAFQTYKSGIFSDPNCKGTTLNHTLLVVGYNTEKSSDGSVDYWIARNSWGTTWGEKGYIRILRNKNVCGVGKEMVQPYAI